MYIIEGWGAENCLKCMHVLIVRGSRYGPTVIIMHMTQFGHFIRSADHRDMHVDITIWDSVQQNHPCDTFSNFSGQANEK